MDAVYLKKNVNEALTEALASMAVGMPDDKVEYMGTYLKSYCERKRAQSALEKEVGEAESKWAAFEAENDEKKAVAKKAEDAATARADKLTDFLMNIESKATSKQDAMDQVTAFTAEYLGVPGCYIGTKKTINEVDTLYYYSANDDAQRGKVVGKNLTASAGDDGEDAPQRQGVSFDAFKAPEVPEVEPPEDAPEDWAPPPPPGPQPLVVENCMRDTRCKFYGIPKLGSFLAVPLTYNSSDHVEGIVEGEAPAEPEAAAEQAEGEEAPAEDAPAPEEGAEDAPPAEPKKIWVPAKTISQSMLLCLDTVGKYKAFGAKDVEIATSIGAALIKAFKALETKQFEAQSQYLDGAKGQAEKVAELMAPHAEAEAAALAALAEEMNPPAAEPADGEEAAAPVVIPESEKAMKEAAAVLKVHTDALAGEELASLVSNLAAHSLPATAGIVNLLFALAMLTGTDAAAKDIYGEITWNQIVANVIPGLNAGIAAFDPTTDITKMKEFCEANAVLAGEGFPPSCAVCTALTAWTTKAVAAADANAAHVSWLAEQAAAAAEVVAEEE